MFGFSSLLLCWRETAQLQQETFWRVCGTILHFLCDFKASFMQDQITHQCLHWALFNCPACPVAQLTSWYVLIFIVMQVNDYELLLSGFHCPGFPTSVSDKTFRNITRQKWYNYMNLKLHSLLKKKNKNCSVAVI